jgi:hypothetical protein
VFRPGDNGGKILAGPGIAGRALALDTVGGAKAQCLVRWAVVEGLIEGQDVVDLDLM